MTLLPLGTAQTKDGQKLPSKEKHQWYNTDNYKSTPTETRNVVQKETEFSQSERTD